ncbi:MAG: prolyl oligopeptidase family serine peptidase [Cytophagales bacterium]|nr:prolyl oligopeptidase family serine peptidase [Bernardetiaceae bacterium]MDW8205176.1 prolyl oligopeptidase family serine peptidase [Cytophagales bacterium]
MSAQNRQSRSAVQQPTVGKKPLHHGVYDSWKEIAEPQIANNGRLAVFAINPQEGDGKLLIKNLTNNQEDSVPRASGARISFDDAYVVFRIKPPFEVMKNLRRQKKKREEMPRDTLGIYQTASRKIVRIGELQSFKMPEKAAGWLAYLLEPALPPKSATKTDTAKAAKPAKAPKKESNENGSKLVLRNFPTGKETIFPFVTDYHFAVYGQALTFVTTGNDSTLQPGVYRYDLAKQQLQRIATGKGKYKSLTISEDGSAIGFMANRDTAKASKYNFVLCVWQNGQDSAQIVAQQGDKFMPPNWIINEHANLRFSKNGKRLFFGTSPQPLEADTTLLPEEVVQVDIWSWQDGYIQPQQKVRLEQDKKRSYMAVYHLPDRKLVQLGDASLPNIILGDEGNADWAVAENNQSYITQISWNWNTDSDIYLINLTDGSRKVIAQAVKANPALSPQAQYVYWFNATDTALYTYHIGSNKLIKLSNHKRWVDEQNDIPDYPRPYGIAGWTENDQEIWVYDRYDIWTLHPQTGQARNLTKSGRNKRLRYRYVRLDNEERFINSNQPVLLRIFSEISKESGFARMEPGWEPAVLVSSEHSFGTVIKAKNADKLLVTRGNFTEFPDLHLTDLNFTDLRRISNANPQQAAYLWGTVELVKWISNDGIPLEGLLYKPENIDPSKKYPMIVYYYERNSDNLYEHIPPSPGRSIINYTYYVSNGYVVFVPDIVYKIGYPGESAYNCIMPGIMKVLSKGFVDPQRIGLQGHSWGGYQTAYMITRTNLFRAAEAGAPVVNMTSAYGGIRWESGLSRIHQYEHTQSRIGGTLWEKPLHFLENSPLFYAPKVNTPLLMMHNDDDGAVPWYQGIEFFMALKRLQKPVWMLNYNGEKHGLTQRKNRKDFTIRMAQFFDHYLKDAPMPAWMEKGIPMTEKGINLGY